MNPTNNDMVQSFLIRLVYIVVWFSNLTFWLYVVKVRQAINHFPIYKIDSIPSLIGINSRLLDWVLRFAFAAVWLGTALFIDSLLFNRKGLKIWDVLIFLLAVLAFILTIYSKSFAWNLN